MQIQQKLMLDPPRAFFSFWGKICQLFRNLLLDIVELTRSFMSKLAESGANWIYFDANSVLTKLVKKSAEYTPLVITAHSEARLLTFEQAAHF